MRRTKSSSSICRPTICWRGCKPGKVYVADAGRYGDRSASSASRTCSRLRELALRRTADRVDAAALEFAGQAPSSRPWLARDRFLIAVSPDDQAEQLVRIGKRFADALDAEWLVVSVETPQLLKLSEARAQPAHRCAAPRRIAGRRDGDARRRLGRRTRCSSTPACATSPASSSARPSARAGARGCGARRTTELVRRGRGFDVSVIARRESRVAASGLRHAPRRDPPPRSAGNATGRRC